MSLSSLRCWSCVILWSFSCFLRASSPSRRTLRTEMRACSAYLAATRVSSLRRSSLRSGMGTRMVWPSVWGLRPSPASRMAFHEGAAAFDVVLAVEAARDQRLASGAVDLHAGLADLGDDALHRFHGEWRVLGDERAVVPHIALELRFRHGTIDQPHALRFWRGEMARGEEDLLGVGRADEIDQLLDAAPAISQPQPRRRDAEARILRGDAQIAAQRDAESAADAEAVDHGDGRLAHLLQRRQRALGDLVVLRDAFGRGALLLELRDVGAGDERLVAGAPEDDDADIGIAREMVEDDRHRLPHVQRQRVVPRWIVERHPADRSVTLGNHTLGRRNHAVRPPQTTPSRRSAATAWSS